MKLIDKKGKLFGVINILDLLAILFVLFVVAGVAFKIFGSKVTGLVSAPQEIVYTVRVPKATELYFEEMKKNDFPQQLTAGEGYVGGAYLTEAYTEPHIEYVEALAGDIVASPEGELVDIVCTIKADISNTSIVSVGTQEIRIGKEHIVKTKFFEMSGIVETMDIRNKG